MVSEISTVVTLGLTVAWTGNPNKGLLSEPMKGQSRVSWRHRRESVQSHKALGQAPDLRGTVFSWVGRGGGRGRVQLCIMENDHTEIRPSPIRPGRQPAELGHRPAAMLPRKLYFFLQHLVEHFRVRCGEEGRLIGTRCLGAISGTQVSN